MNEVDSGSAENVAALQALCDHRCASYSITLSGYDIDKYTADHPNITVAEGRSAWMKIDLHGVRPDEAATAAGKFAHNPAGMLKAQVLLGVLKQWRQECLRGGDSEEAHDAVKQKVVIMVPARSLPLTKLTGLHYRPVLAPIACESFQQWWRRCANH